MEMLRRVVLIGVMVLVLRGRVTQLVIANILCLIFLLLQMQACLPAVPPAYQPASQPASQHASTHEQLLTVPAADPLLARLPFLDAQAVPYEDPADDYLASASSFSLAAIFLCCIMFKIGASATVATRTAVSCCAHETNEDRCAWCRLWPKCVALCP